MEKNNLKKKKKNVKFKSSVGLANWVCYLDWVALGQRKNNRGH